MRNAAYELLRELGMRPTVARYFLTGLRKRGFVLVEEKKLISAANINRKIDTIIKLMRAGRRRK